VELDEDLDLVLPDQCSSLEGAPRVKEGQEFTVPRLHYPAGGKGKVLLLDQQEEDVEDMGTIKRRAQVRGTAATADCERLWGLRGCAQFERVDCTDGARLCPPRPLST
jgi:hypothetical protein